MLVLMSRKELLIILQIFLGKADEHVQKQFLKNIAYPLDIKFGDSLKEALAKVRASKPIKSNTATAIVISAEQ